MMEKVLVAVHPQLCHCLPLANDPNLNDGQETRLLQHWVCHDMVALSTTIVFTSATICEPFGVAFVLQLAVKS